MNDVTKLALSFVEENWDKIDLEKCRIGNYTKKKLISEVNKNYSDACWIVTDVMNWGCDKDYLKEYVIECEDWLVIKIGENYWKYEDDNVGLVNVLPKTKTVIYFE